MIKILRKSNGQYNGSHMTAEFPLMAKLLVCLGIALLLTLSLLLIGQYVRNYANVVMEVWANMDNAAYTNYVRGYATSTPDEPAVIMNRIAGCESEWNRNSFGSHYDAKGRVRRNINKNGSWDIGRWQINLETWETKAHELGYNVYTPEGNEKMAYWIYNNRGTEDWYSSKDCWSK